MKLTDKQKEFVTNANKTWNGKIGATRSGKTWLDFSYRIMAKTRELKDEEGIFVLMGVTNSTIERNILEPMRKLYGDKQIGNIQNGKSIVMLFGQVYHVVGHEKISAVNRIQGASIKYCYIDEIVRMNKETFEMLKSRLDQDYSMCDFTGNPEQPSHFIKQFIDEQEYEGDMYIQTYTIDDNPMLPEKFVERLKREYSGTVYYNRYILGQWTLAEGQIYTMFGKDNIINHNDWYATDDDNNYTHPMRDIAFVHIGVDFGGNKSATAFNCTGFTKNLKYMVTLKDYKFPKELDPIGLEKEFVNFVKEVEEEYSIKAIFADSAEQVLIRGLQGALVSNRLPYKVMNSRKGEIVDRIRFYQRMMNARRYFILDSCNDTVQAFYNAVWDSKSTDDKRLDDGTSNIDNLDAQEYSTEILHNKLLNLYR